MLRKLFGVKGQNFRFFGFFSKTVSFLKEILQNNVVDLKILYKNGLYDFFSKYHRFWDIAIVSVKVYIICTHFHTICEVIYSFFSVRFYRQDYSTNHYDVILRDNTYLTVWWLLMLILVIECYCRSGFFWYFNLIHTLHSHIQLTCLL